MIIALDIGTSSTRATLYDARGARVEGGEHRVLYELRTTADGGVEHDAASLLDAAAICIDAVLPRAGHVRGVGICTFWHGLLGFDARGRPVTPVYMWGDTRSAAEVDDLRARLDERAVHARTGCHLHSTYWPAKIRWHSTLAERRPADRWGSIGELLALEWFGDAATSVSMASGTGLFDQRAARWDPEMLEAAGIDERRLFPLRDRDEPWTRLREPWAARWPALRRAVWFPAVGDGAAGNVGCGCTGASRIAINLGTSAAMRLVNEDPPRETPWGLWRYRVDRKLSVVGGALSEGGNVYAWCVNALRLPPEPTLERELAAAVERDHGLALLPFLAGERSPGWNARARGAVAGLTLGTTPIDILHAALESVALRLALVYGRLIPLADASHEIVISGGAVERSRVWAQMIADALGHPLTISVESEASSRGAALLAFDALGLPPGLAGAWVPGGERIEPDPRRRDRHRAAAARQERLYRALFGDRISDRRAER
jgi:gluconokinase